MMKKAITEERRFCDFCEEPAYEECLVCGKDLCRDHRLVLRVYLDREDKGLRAPLCPKDTEPLLPFLDSLKGKSTSWEKVGHNPEFNEARLGEILNFLRKAVPASRF